MNMELTNLVRQYKKEFGTPIQHGVAVNKKLKLALNQLLESQSEETERKALIASLYDAFHTIKGEVINQEGMYKKTKYFYSEGKYFEIYISLINGELSHGIKKLDSKPTNKIINHII